MIDWNEYITTRRFTRHRCNFCREWFDEKDDVKMHIRNNHDVKIEIKYCKECKACFIPIMKDQVICGRRDCLLKSN